MAMMERLEDLANKLDKPLFHAWAVGTLFLQWLERYVDLPPVVSAYANLCGDYAWPVIGAKLFGLKGLVGGTALMIGSEATQITENIPLLKAGTPDLWDLPAAGVGAIEGFFLDRYYRRNRLKRYRQE